jgi:hypothetical protein
MGLQHGVGDLFIVNRCTQTREGLAPVSICITITQGHNLLSIALIRAAFDGVRGLEPLTRGLCAMCCIVKSF